MDGQIWLFISRMSERSDGEEALRGCRKSSHPTLDWPVDHSHREARRLRAKTLWRWVAQVMAHLLRRAP